MTTKTIRVTVSRAFYFEGAIQAPGTVLDCPARLATELIGNRQAELAPPNDEAPAGDPAADTEPAATRGRGRPRKE